MDKFFEPFFEDRIQKAKDRASKLFVGTVENTNELIDFYKFVISRHYGLPFFDKYFEERTLDDLAFEAELIRLQSVPKEVINSDIVNKNQDQVEELFEDWGDIDSDTSDIDQKFDEYAKEFMKTGEFKNDPFKED